MNNVQKESGVVKLVAIYNVWSDTLDLLEHSLENIISVVDGVIVVWSENSNYGNYDASIKQFASYYPDPRVKFYQCEPLPKAQPFDNERLKRNFGLEKAKQGGFTHFIMMDADEFYFHEDVRSELKRFKDSNLQGLVCRSKVYFRSPTLTIGLDTTLVPFIHKLTSELHFDFNREYPFAWTNMDKVPFTPKKRIRIDPTRQMNIRSGVEWSEIVMHHYSWVRKDPMVKIKNSSAKVNIENSTIHQDYLMAKEGYYCKFYEKELARCPNFFGLPEM
jgi:hypothetical protein